MKVVAIVQARMGSSRLPGKVMKTMQGRTMIELILSRLTIAKEVNQIILATTDEENDTKLAQHAENLGYICIRGSENDVLDRYLLAAKESEAKIIVRITGDCPIVDPQIIDSVIKQFKEHKVDYSSNINPPTFPDGLDVEVFSRDALEVAAQEAKEISDREHVTPFIRNDKRFKQYNYENETDFSHLRWTVDDPLDFQVVESIYNHFSPDINFSWQDVMDLLNKQPQLFEANAAINRNQGSDIGTGQKLYQRAKRVIPGGNMLLSKRPEMFLPEYWPAYFSHAKGCNVWDLDGNEFIDMSIMGIGTNILGYAHPEVDDAVRSVVEKSNMSTLNCPEEVYLAERLVDLHPWADMVRFARSGGEANAVGIRIARAASGKDNVAICGYHGWHDWYLSANLGETKNLDGHLLPGLKPKGVPRNLQGTVFPFHYNDFNEIQSIVDDNDIGVIKMEVSRNEGPKDQFLQKVRELATKRNIVLVFDECTSGFRETFGGLHKKYGVEPDMAMFGKALGNGYAITGVLGRREIMEAAQASFISSTFWTERIGPTAGLKTLEVMEKTESWSYITNNGLNIRNQWQQLADSHGLDIEHWGLPALTGFSFKSQNNTQYKTLITQEMLEKGYLASNSIYVCIEHTQEIIDAYIDALDSVFAMIKQCEDGRDVSELLRGPICHDGFKRLN